MATTINDVFHSDAFQLMALTNLITQIPYTSTRFSEELNFVEDVSYQDSFAIDLEAHQIYLLGMVARGEKLPVARRSNRRIVKFEIPRMGEQCGVSQDEVRGRRASGGMTETSLEQMAAQKLGLVNKRWTHSMDFARRMALDGVVIDPYDGTVLVDVCATYKLEQPTVKWDLSDAAFNPVDAIIVQKRLLEDSMGDSVVDVKGWKLLCGRGVYRALKVNPFLQKAWETYDSIGAQISRFAVADQVVPGGFKIADDVQIIDMGRARMAVGNGTDGFLADNQFRLVPDSDDFYRTVYGPSSRISFEAEVLPRYVFPMLRQDDTGIDIEVDGFPLNFVDRPDLIVKGIAKLPAIMANPVEPAVVIP